LSELEKKTNEMKQMKSREDDLKEQIAVVQSNLSELKLRIGDKLNSANE
jgi:hypothetical protein